jgi:hypothetical protein
LIQDSAALDTFLAETAEVNGLEYCAFLAPDGKIVGRSSDDAGLEPLLTVVMGAVVAVIVMAVMLPMFDLSTFAKR